MYQKVATDLNFVDREKEVEKFWEDNHIFEKSMENRKEGSTYTFYDGPPTANGKPHIGHVLTRVIKDMIPRYRTMKGYMFPRKAGWDTHGLPVELKWRRSLVWTEKTRSRNTDWCHLSISVESVWKYKGMWEDFSATVGSGQIWKSLCNYHDYIESEWWALKEIWNKGLLYKDIRSCLTVRGAVPLCLLRSGSGYKDVKNVLPLPALR